MKELDSNIKKCIEEECNSERHGFFKECKIHFYEKYRTGLRFKLKPSSVGYSTIKDILSSCSDWIDSTQIEEKHIDRGAKSLIPLRCKLCLYEWSPTISGIINNGNRCKSCIGNLSWNLEKLIEKASNRPNLDFSNVTEKHVKTRNSIIPMKCKKCLYEWKTSVSSIINGAGCPDCVGLAKYNLARFRNKMSNRTDIDISFVSEKDIVNNKSKVPVGCLNCGYKWKPKINNLVSGDKCPECSGNSPYTLEKLLNKLKDRTDLDTTSIEEKHIINNLSRVPVKCKICSYEWTSSITSLIYAGSGCIKCKISIVVRVLSEFLKKINIPHELEKNLPGMVYKSKLKIDIYIPKMSDGSLPIAVEYDGNFPGSHFSYRNKEEENRHIKTVKRDRIKDNYCLDNGIHVFRIPYSLYEANDPESLKSYFRKGLDFLSLNKEPIVYLADTEPYILRDKKLKERKKIIKIIIKK